MLKLLGALLAFGSCAFLGIAARNRLQKRLQADDAMILALHRMESEIRTRLTPLPDLIDSLAESENMQIRQFFSALSQRLQQAQGRSLSYLWHRVTEEQADNLPLAEEERQILRDAAGYLGLYDAQEQAAMLHASAERLEAVREEARIDLKNKGKLYRSAGIALGLLIILVLL